MARKKVERNIAFDDQRKRYYVTFEYGIDPETGKQIRKTKTFQKLAQARSALRKHETDRENNQVVMPSDITLAEWLTEWLHSVGSLNREVTTAYGYQKIIEKHIIPALGEIPLQNLKPQHLQRYYAALVREKGLHPNTARKHHDLLSVTLRQAVRQELLTRSPTELVEPPKHKPPDIHYYSAVTLQRLFTLSEGTRCEVLIKLAGYLGLRREEILGLTWDYINFQSQTLEVRYVRTSAGSQIVTKDPKTKSSRRTLYMPNDLVYCLRRELGTQRYYKEQFGSRYHDGGYVLCYLDGRPMRPNYASDLFVKFVRDNGLPPLTLHGLRHSFASIANSKGLSIFDIGMALGHSSTSTTSRIYTHLLDPDHRELMAALWDQPPGGR